MLDWINQNSGLFSLLAVVASVIVSIAIFKKHRKYDELKEERTKDEIAKRELQDAQNELDAMNEHSPFPYTSEMDRLIRARANYLNKKLNQR